MKRLSFVKVIYFHYLCTIKPNCMEDINRIKVVLAEKKRTNKWLAEQLEDSLVMEWIKESYYLVASKLPKLVRQKYII